MATVKIAYVAAAGITCTLTSLGSGSARRGAVIDNSSNLYDDAIVAVTVTAAAASVSATGTVDVYGYASGDDGTTYETGGSTDAAYTTTNEEKLHFMGSIPVTANNAVRTGVFSAADAFGSRLPRNWGIVVINNSGAALAAAGHITKYQGVTYTVA